MSASTWTNCPQCYDRAYEAYAEEVAAVGRLYGTVPRAEYEAAVAGIARKPSRGDYETLREDYEFYGAKDGAVEYYYSGSCNVCGLEVRFDGKHPFYPEEA